MFEFKWHVPGPTPSEVCLRVHSRTGWLGRKVLTCDGQTVFRRGPLAGVEAQFAPPGDGPALELRMVRMPGSADWRPVLLADGVELPEATGVVPPRIVPPPKSLMVPVGLTYLVMALVVAMLPQTSAILNALYLRADMCKTVMTVAEAPGAAIVPLATAPAAAADRPRITTPALPPATLGQPYDFTLGVSGGRPPYTWKVLGKRGLPAGLALDTDDGRIRGVPAQAGQFPLALRVVDDSYAASRDITRWIIPFVVSAACLLGFLAMRRWSVYVYGSLVAIQAAGALALALPVSMTALGVQVLLCLLGAAHLGKMR
jgi:hypothetical protein